jgi:hypothetical protein
MNGLVVASVLVPFALFLLCAVPSLLLAQRRNAELCRRSPNAMPYGWGYFLGYSGVIGGLLAGVIGLVMIFSGMHQDWLPLAIAYALVMAIASYGVLKRCRWGWLLHIPLSQNMALWAFNSVYVSNRWREFPWR